MRNHVTVLLVAFFLVSCAPAEKIVPTITLEPSKTSTPIPQSPTPTPTIWWIMATPLNLSTSNSGEIDFVIEKLHPGICVGSNLAILTPPPIDVPPPTLEITEIVTLPDPNPNYVNERADNFDKSRTAFVGCEPKNCGNLYVKDNKTGKVYKVDFRAASYRPLQWLQWINKDTVLVAQSSNPRYGLIVAINFEKQHYEYYGMVSECISTPTP